MRILVFNRQQAVKNIRRYNVDLMNFARLRDLMPTHRDWYYIPELNAFGPSKFVGFVDMTGSRYSNPDAEGGVRFDGGRTQKALSNLFAPVPEGSAESGRLRDLLEQLFNGHGKTPRSNSRFYLPS
jgi:hypothetical protein